MSNRNMKGSLLSTVLACVVALLLSAAVCDAQSYIRSGDSQYSNPLYNWDGKYSEPLLNVSGTVPIVMLILLILQ